MVKITIPSIDDTPLRFGKHRGSTPNQVAQTDPSYIVWLYENANSPPIVSRPLYLACEIEKMESDAEQHQDDYRDYDYIPRG